MKTDTPIVHGLDQIPMSDRQRARVDDVVRRSSAVVGFLASIARYAGLSERPARPS